MLAPTVLVFSLSSRTQLFCTKAKMGGCKEGHPVQGGVALEGPQCPGCLCARSPSRALLTPASSLGSRVLCLLAVERQGGGEARDPVPWLPRLHSGETPLPIVSSFLKELVHLSYKYILHHLPSCRRDWSSNKNEH